MLGLLEALNKIAAPDASIPEALQTFGDNLLASVDPADLDDLVTVTKAAAECGPEFIVLAEAAARAEHATADLLLKTATAVLPSLTNLVFLDSADVALNSPLFLKAKSRTLALTLYGRLMETKATNGLQAYAYLETLARLGLTNSTARFRVLEFLNTVELSDSEDLLERIPKLMGFALDHWNDEGLEDKLRMLLELEVTRADAAYELAQLTLRTALEGRTTEEVLDGLRSARNQFTTVESMEEAREDAKLYRCALELTVAFVSGEASTDEATETFNILTAAIAHRAAMTTRSSFGNWAKPRRQAEVEWFTLARTLQGAMDPLREPSWNTPGITLARVLAAYRASRSVTVMGGDGLRIVLEPVVEAAFLQRDGLFNHLIRLVEDGELPFNELEVARHLLAAIAASKGEPSGDVMGKAWAAAPDLAAELSDRLSSEIADELVAASERAPNFLRALNEGAKTRARQKARESDPIVDQLLERILASLKECPGLGGTALEEFTEMLTFILKFAADRANIGRMNGGPIVNYLFAPEDGKAFTESFLQIDVANWLKATPLRRFVEMEQHDVAAGRADITVTQNHKFTIEVKRELTDVSPAALLKAYGGQAAAYSVTGPAVSLEMVLDLTNQVHGTPSLEESVWVQEVAISGGQPRHVVTLVVHGNRVTPRMMKSN